MKRVILEELTLINFKGIRNMTIRFDREHTEIFGDNATGKTTIVDGWSWLLFGKDSQGNSDTKFGIKTVDAAGEVIPKLDHEVSALLHVDNIPVRLRRVLTENWVVPRGEAEAVLKGNTTSYYYDDVPLKESEYKAKIDEIIDENLFRLLTNPHYFPNLDWAVRREILLKVAGSPTLEDVAGDNSSFKELLDRLTGKSLDDYKAELNARKRKIKDALDLMPARFDELNRATPEAPDYRALEKKKEDIEGKLKEIDAAMQDALALSRKENEDKLRVQEEINRLKAKLQQTRFEATQKKREEVNRLNERASQVAEDYVSMQRKIEATQKKREEERRALTDEFTAIETKIQTIKVSVEQKREDWHRENAKEYDPLSSVLCPNCGFDLKGEDNKKMEERFNESKIAVLERINKDGKELAERKAELELKYDEISKRLEDSKAIINKERDAMDAELAGLMIAVKANPITGFVAPTDDEIPELAVIQAEIDRLMESQSSEPTETGESDLKLRRDFALTELDEIKEKLAVREVIENNLKRKKQLEEEEKDLAQQKADIESEEFLADSLVKRQMTEVERRVNMKFRYLRVKMFTTQINGGEKPDCVLIGLDGAKYLDTNSAGKIVIGLDIINTLSEYYGVAAPIFIDNSESITKLPEINSQLIETVVIRGLDKMVVLRSDNKSEVFESDEMKQIMAKNDAKEMLILLSRINN